jgi:uncharacterized protein YoxC
MNPEIIFNVAVAVIAAAALVVAMLAVHAARLWRSQCEALQSSVAALRRELELVASISVRTGRRMQRVEDEFTDVAERVDQVELRAAPVNGALDRAIALARSGAQPERLEQQFGLSTGEADLVARLHGQKLQAVR